MTLLRLHHDGLRRMARDRRWTLARAIRRLRATLGIMHRAIMAARLRRHQPMFDNGDEQATCLQRDLARYAQRPLILDDKWEF